MHGFATGFQRFLKIRLLLSVMQDGQAAKRLTAMAFVFLWLPVCTAPVYGQVSKTEAAQKTATRIAFFKYAGSLYHAISPELLRKQTDSFATLARNEGNNPLLYQIELFRKTQAIRVSKPESYVQEFVKLESWVEQTGSEDLKGAYHFLLGNYQYDEKNYADGFANMLQAIKIFEETGFENIPEAGYYLNQLGNKYYHLGEYDKALFYLEKAENTGLLFPRFLFDNLNTQSLCRKARQEAGKAFALVERSIQLAEQDGDSVWVGIANGNKGQLLLEKGEYAAAIQCLEKDYRLNQNVEPDNTAFSCLYLAAAFLKSLQPADAIFYLKEAARLSRARQTGNLPQLYQFYTMYYEKLAGYHSLSGNNELAYRYLDSSRLVKDSLNKLSDAQVVANAEQRIAMQSHLDQLKLIEKENQNAILKRNLVLVAGFLLLLLLILALRYQRVQNKKNKLIFEQKEALLLAQQRETEARLQKAEIEMSDYIKMITAKNNLLEQMKAGFQEAGQITNEAERKEKTEQLLSTSLLTDEDWGRFKELFDALFPGYSAYIKNKVPDLSPAEIRLLCLLKLNLPNKEVALMLGIAQPSVNKLRYRLRRKLESGNPAIQLEELVRAEA